MIDDWSLDELRDERFHVAHLIFDYEQGALSSTEGDIADLKRELTELDARIAAREAKGNAPPMRSV